MQLLYQNPAIIEPLFLFVQLTGVIRQKDSIGRTLTQLRLRVHPAETHYADTTLTSVLYHVDKATRLWEGCEATFRFTGYDASPAIGRWAKIYLVPSRWQSEEYSTVQYVRQTDLDRRTIARLETADDDESGTERMIPRCIDRRRQANDEFVV